ncbi:MAG TPA: glycosyltransferase [Haliangiales bacterium]|nr:glycosyltransferase [Haliangiales bacterium]
MPDGVEILSLKPVVKCGAEQYRALDGSLDEAQVVAHRSRQLVAAAAAFRPDVLVVDHAPIGMKGELLQTLEHVRRARPKARILLGLRDILDEPEVVRALWQRQAIYAALEQYYDSILVYGNREHFALDEAYALPPPVVAKLSYSGYLAKHEPLLPAAAIRAQYGLAQPLLLATAGGGADGGPILRCTLEAIPLMRRDFPGLQALVVTGPLLDAAEREELARAATRMERVHLTDFAPHMLSCLVAADVVVSMGGYNTVSELLALRRQSVIVPRTTPRKEQLMRARILEERRLVRMLDPAEATPTTLAARLTECLLEGNPVPGSDTGSLAGTEHATAEILRLLPRRRKATLQQWVLGHVGAHPR